MNHTLLALLSPPGVSAIACLGIAGPRAWEIVRDHFRGQRPLPEIPSGRTTFHGWLHDDVIVFVRQIEPTPIVEVHCHGGREVVRRIQQTLAQAGAEIVDSGEWTRAFDDRADLLEIVTHALTTRTAAIALDQYLGAIDRALAEPANFSRLRELIPVGEHLDRPWRVALAGQPNVGKSSLVNALAGYTRCVVSPQPGTTRDVVTTTIALDGWPIELIDTAGLRDAVETLEAEGIARGQAAASSADLVVRVFDATIWASEDAPRRSDNREILVVNKWDCTPNRPAPSGAILVSALTGIGMTELADVLVTRLIPHPPAPGEAVPITADHRRRIHESPTRQQEIPR